MTEIAVIVDTTGWSKVFRWKNVRGRDLEVAKALTELIDAERAIMIGAVRQEVLSGIAEKAVYEKLKIKLTKLIDYVPQTAEYELAAEFCNTCRKNGVQGSPTDFLICAIAAKNDWRIFTDDLDFPHYRDLLPIKLYEA
ncbi:MAG: PIN domain nuclease [Planctomycetota bacterium]|jgi:predicted nucleic acid-binding protein|nr:PIN domain nuclease [Planctomycetota bacterium]